MSVGARDRLASLCVGVGAALGATLLLASPAGSSADTVVLGKKGLLPYGRGWGQAHPRLIFNGGVPNGKAWNLRWTGWGSPVAHAHGLTWIYRPGGGYFGKPAEIELRAFRIGRCSPAGPWAYTRLGAREAVRPGGPLSRWFPWGGWTSICVGR